MLRQFAEFLFLGQILGIQVGRHKVVQEVGDPREEHWVVCHPADDGSSRYDALEYPRFFGLPNKRTPAVTVAGRSVIVTRAQDVLGNSGVVLVVAGFGGHGFGSKLLQARGHCRAVGFKASPACDVDVAFSGKIIVALWKADWADGVREGYILLQGEYSKVILIWVHTWQIAFMGADFFNLIRFLAVVRFVSNVSPHVCPHHPCSFFQEAMSCSEDVSFRDESARTKMLRKQLVGVDAHMPGPASGNRFGAAVNAVFFVEDWRDLRSTTALDIT